MVTIKPKGSIFFSCPSRGVFGGDSDFFVLALNQMRVKIWSFEIPIVSPCLGTQCMQVSPKLRNHAAGRSISGVGTYAHVIPSIIQIPQCPAQHRGWWAWKSELQ